MADPRNKDTRRGLATAASAVARIAKPLFRRRGFAEGAIITDWPAIVGAHLSSIVTPERLAFERDRRDHGTLMVRVAPAFGPEVQHLSPQIIERVNVHFGYPAVAQLKILPGTMPERRVPPPLEPAPPPPDESTLADIANVPDEGLRAALERLAKALKTTAAARSAPPPNRAKTFGDK
ncbi:MAG TPA: DUF721 domain-containing protein [Alphaproteobacteria bacterium]|nr:DUF721 domain-containing protein [Alphaproteobacteria bacterium]